MKRVVLSLAFFTAFAACAVFVSTAGASQVISTSTVTGLTLQLNAKGEALLTYNSDGKRVHVLAWGAMNASPTKPGHAQVAFQLDYSGGYQKYFQDEPERAGARRAVPQDQGHARLPDEPGRQAAARAAARRRQLLEDGVPRRLRQVRRAEARLGASPRARRRTAATGPCRSGSASFRTTASPAPASTPPARFTSRTGRARCPC